MNIVFWPRAKLCLQLVGIVILVTILICQNYITNDIEKETNVRYDTIKQWLVLRNEQKNLSTLGQVLFLGIPEPIVTTKRRYQILFWKHGKRIERRLLKNFSKESIDPFQYCSVNNCDITYEDSAITTADIVIFHLHQTKSPKELPTKRGSKEQIWAYLIDESPQHIFSGSSFTRGPHNKKYTIRDYNGLFNWSMSYRVESDIPVPYGRTIVKRRLTNDDFILEKRRDVLVAIMTSNCIVANHRWDYIQQLKKYIQVDVYGKCGTIQCPGHFARDCPALDQYLFYLAFENANCDEYITEKVWWNALHKNTIPIVMGAGQNSYDKLLPPNSYINTDDFANPFSLAQYILRLNRTTDFLDYYTWKNDFEVLNEHGYFQSRNYHYCRVCQAMNYNDKSEKVYRNLEDLWDIRKACRSAWDAIS